MHTTWPLMDEHIVKDLGKACHTVFEWNCSVEAEQGQVKVSPRHIFRLQITI